MHKVNRIKHHRCFSFKDGRRHATWTCNSLLLHVDFPYRHLESTIDFKLKHWTTRIEWQSIIRWKLWCVCSKILIALFTTYSLTHWTAGILFNDGCCCWIMIDILWSFLRDCYLTNDKFQTTDSGTERDWNEVVDAPDPASLSTDRLLWMTPNNSSSGAEYESARCFNCYELSTWTVIAFFSNIKLAPSLSDFDMRNFCENLCTAMGNLLFHIYAKHWMQFNCLTWNLRTLCVGFCVWWFVIGCTNLTTRFSKRWKTF